MNRSSTVRCVVLGCLRAAGLVFGLLAALSLKDVIRVVLQASIAGDASFSSWSWFLDNDGVPIVLSFMIWLTCAIGLCGFGPRLAAWLTPIPGARCLKCGHTLDPGNNGICPECGAA